MNLFAEIRGLVTDSLAALAAEGVLPAGLDYAQVAVEPPRDAAHGDMATNAAMVLAKPAGMAPRAIAEALAARLSQDPRIIGADVAGPVFKRIAQKIFTDAPSTNEIKNLDRKIPKQESNYDSYFVKYQKKQQLIPNLSLRIIKISLL